MIEKLKNVYDSGLVRKIEIYYGILFNIVATFATLIMPLCAWEWRDTPYLYAIAVVWATLVYKNQRMFGFVRKRLSQLFKIAHKKNLQNLE